MTARKVHFDFHAEGLEAWCGATPRNGAAPLELSERRREVTCANCLKMIEDYDREADETTQALVRKLQAETDVEDDNAVEAEFETMVSDFYVTESHLVPAQMDLAGHTGDLYRSIADRNGVGVHAIEYGFKAGYLKR